MHFIDVSMYQGDINWKRVAASGIKAAYLKASEGVNWNDPDFQKNRKAANAAGIHVGAYHFADMYDGSLEAKHFLHTIEHIGPKDLKPVLDVEVWPKDKKFPAAYVRHFVDNFNRTVQARTGVWPMFYSYAPFIEQAQFPGPVGNGLWIAAYGRNDGQEYPVYAPKPWKHFVAHQFTSAGRLPGVNGKVDVSDSPHGLRPLLAHPVKNVFTRF